MSQIKAGDLVMVVRATHSCCEHLIGQVRIASKLLSSVEFDCSECGQKSVMSGAAVMSEQWGKYGIPRSWLIKIDPPALPETIERDEEITA